MNRVTRHLDGPAGMYFQELLAARLDQLRKKFSRGDLGASAIELAIITAIIGGVAVMLAILIQSVVNKKAAIIGGL
jgi:Flp pilus assembly pilin Flp